MKQGRTKDTLVLGFAMFAIFFGAGNLIFPPSIGINTGADVIPGILGMTLTGILFPMLAMYAVVNMGSDFVDLSRHINSWWHQMFRIIGLLIVLFGTIPRCGAVACETGMRGIFPDVPDWVNVAFLLVFFALAYFFASNRSKVIDMIGAYATPILLVALLIIVVLVFVVPIGAPTGGTVDNAFTYATLTAYNTGDIPTGLICAGIFLGSIKAKGYTEYKDQKSILVRATGVSNVLAFSGPLFTLIFPMSVVMTVLGVCKRFVPNDGAWKGAVYVATIISAYDAFVVARANGLHSIATDGLDRLMSYIPLSDLGFDWLIPTVIGFVVGAAIYAAVKGKSAAEKS